MFRRTKHLNTFCLPDQQPSRNVPNSPPAATLDHAHLHGDSFHLTQNRFHTPLGMHSKNTMQSFYSNRHSKSKISSFCSPRQNEFFSSQYQKRRKVVQNKQKLDLEHRKLKAFFVMRPIIV